MIKSFSHKGLEDFFYDGVKKGIQPRHANKIAAILDRLDATNDIRDMTVPDYIYYSRKRKAVGLLRCLEIGA